MTDLRNWSAYAEKREGLNNKFYEVEAVETEDGRATWTFRWGRIGSAGQTKSGSTYSFDLAKLTCQEQFDTKLNKGYREVTAMEAIAAAAQDVVDRPVNGLDPVEVEIPSFGAGPSEARCRAFAKKYLDKMNIIRKSRDDLGGAYYDQIISIVESCKAEWKRMKASKTHATNLGPQAEEGFQALFGALRKHGLLLSNC